jgi:hypothetical protein
VPTQLIDEHGRQRDTPNACRRLGRTGLNGAPIQLRETPSHVQYAAGQIDVTASQRDQLAPPQARERSSQHQGSESPGIRSASA